MKNVLFGVVILVAGVGVGAAIRRPVQNVVRPEPIRRSSHAEPNPGGTEVRMVQVVPGKPDEASMSLAQIERDLLANRAKQLREKFRKTLEELKNDPEKLAAFLISYIAGGGDLDEEVITAVLELAAHPDAQVRSAALYALGWSKDPRAAAALFEALRGDRESGVRLSAVDAVREHFMRGERESAGALEEIRRAMDTDPATAVRTMAVSAYVVLKEKNEATSIELMGRLKAEREAEVRSAYVMALGCCEGPEATRTIWEVARNTTESPAVRVTAVQSLGLDDGTQDEIVSGLKTLLTGETSEVVKKSIENKIADLSGQPRPHSDGGGCTW